MHKWVKDWGWKWGGQEDGDTNDGAIIFPSSSSSWPSPFIDDPVGTAADCDVVSSKGRLLTTTEAGTFKASRTTYGAESFSDLRIRGRLEFEAGKPDQYIQTVWRMNGYSGSSDFPDFGYAWSFRPHLNRMELIITSGSGFSIHSGFDYTFTSGVDVRFDNIIEGSQVTLYIWNVGDVKPGSPQYDNSIVPPTGSGLIGFSQASALGGQEVFWSELIIEHI